MTKVAPTKLLYVVVVDNVEWVSGRRDGRSFRYTRPLLQSTLQLMGCKARHAFKMSRSIFEVIRSECFDDDLPPCMEESGENGDSFMEGFSCCGVDEESKNVSNPFDLYKRNSTIAIGREKFLDITYDTLSRYKYVGPSQRSDLMLACRVRERKESVTVLLCGTSGCGKSTLSALLGSRLGITTVISTDSIRHMMRSFSDEKQNPLLWASTYHAGEFLDPMAVAEAKAKRKAQKLVFSPKAYKEGLPGQGSIHKFDGKPPLDFVPSAELIGKKQMTIEGFKAQSEMVIDSLDRLITAWEDKKESIIVEGVHLSLNFVMGLMKKHPSIIPFMIYIGNEEKHVERFAVRAKYMALDPSRNKYVKYIRNIRIIQEYLCNRADKHLVPKVNNTNVDKSVAAIHATVFSCLRRRQTGEKLYDPLTNTIFVINEEYKSQCMANSLSSKGMLQLIRRKGSTRHLMALLNFDGTIAKAWPVESCDGKGQTIGVDRENPMYGPMDIAKAEPVNLQFGMFGISAWPSDTGCTSYTGSLDDSRADGTDTGSRYLSSCCSSPRMSEGHSKELREEFAVFVSEDEHDDLQYGDSDDDIEGPAKMETHSEMEGSVDENLTKLDEEYEDLAIRDSQENGYWSENGGSDSDGGDGGKAAGYGRLSGRHYNLGPKHQENKLELLQIPNSYSMFSDRISEAWMI